MLMDQNFYHGKIIQKLSLNMWGIVMCKVSFKVFCIPPKHFRGIFHLQVKAEGRQIGIQHSRTGVALAKGDWPLAGLLSQHSGLDTMLVNIYCNVRILVLFCCLLFTLNITKYLTNISWASWWGKRRGKGVQSRE